jgi:hypothetical protein
LSKYKYFTKKHQKKKKKHLLGFFKTEKKLNMGKFFKEKLDFK